MIVTAHNPEIDHLEKTYLTQDAAAGATTLYVKNNEKFAASKRVLLGDMGYETSEIVTCGGVTGSTQLTVGATVFAHNADDPIFLLEWDKIKFYKSATEGGTYSLLQTVAIDVDNASRTTGYDDTTAVSTDYYKVSFYNSLTLNESSLSDPISATGFTTKTAGKIIDRHVRRVHDPGYTVLGVEEYLDILNEVNDDLITQTHRPYRFLKTSITLDTTADTNWVALPTNLWKFDRVEFTHTIGGRSRSYSLTPITMKTWDRRYNNGAFSASDELRDIAVDEVNSRLYLGPTPRLGTTGKLELFYWRTFPAIDSVGDAVITPNTLIYRYKLLAEYYSTKSESDNQFARLANNYEQKYGAEVVKMQRVNRLDAGTPREFKPMPGYRKRFVL